MQAVVHHQLPPQLLNVNPYSRTALNVSAINPMLNNINPSGPPVMPTPPVTTRKRKRAQQFTVSYSEVQEFDSNGRLREVIVIEDTPPPPTISPATTHNHAFSASYQPPVYSAPIRTRARARAAAEAQAGLSASTSSAAVVAPAPKKRKRDEDVRAPVQKKTITGALSSHTLPTTKSWASGSAAATDDVRGFANHYLSLLITTQASKGLVSCDDKEGHYIIVTDDLIYRRCTFLVV
jgi:dual-specificity kinase